MTPAVALGPTKIAVAELTAIVPPKPTPYEEVKDKVKDAMLQFRLPAKVREKASDLMQKAKASGDFDKTAKELGFGVETTDGFIAQTP